MMVAIYAFKWVPDPDEKPFARVLSGPSDEEVTATVDLLRDRFGAFSFELEEIEAL